MNGSRQLSAAFWLMVLIQTIGAVDLPGRGTRKMPAPRAYVSIIVAFGLLALLADAGQERAANSMAWVAVSAAAVLGPFGARFVNFLNVVATQFRVQPQATANVTTWPPEGAPAPTQGTLGGLGAFASAAGIAPPF